MLLTDIPLFTGS